MAVTRVDVCTRQGYTWAVTMEAGAWRPPIRMKSHCGNTESSPRKGLNPLLLYCYPCPFSPFYLLPHWSLAPPDPFFKTVSLAPAVSLVMLLLA